MTHRRVTKQAEGSVLLRHRVLCRRAGWRITRGQDWACAYLASRGLRFAIDFGLTNCEDMADAMRERTRTH